MLKACAVDCPVWPQCDLSPRADRTAYHIVGTLVALCDQQGLPSLTRLTLEERRQHSPKIQEDVFQTLGSANVIARYQSHGAGGLPQLKTQLTKWKKLLK